MILSIVINLLLFILAAFIVIMSHEFGHYLFARIFDVQVKRVSFGLGKVLYSFYDKRGTEYAISVFPLGGYVKLLDDREQTVPADLKEKSFNAKSFSQKVLIIIAGPVMNFVLAIILFTIVFTSGISFLKPIIGEVEANSIAANAHLKPGQQIHGVDGVLTKSWQEIIMELMHYTSEDGHVYFIISSHMIGQKHLVALPLEHWELNPYLPEPIKSLGITPYQPDQAAIVQEVLKKSPAANAGMKKGDMIISVNGRYVKNWPRLREFISHRPGESYHFLVKRNRKRLTLSVQLGVQDHWLIGKKGYLGIRAKSAKLPYGLLNHEKYRIGKSWFVASSYTARFIGFNCLIISKLVTGQVSIKSLGGPFSLIKQIRVAADHGFTVLLFYLAILSITLGVLNLLPIPGLDGAQFIYIVIEAIIRRPIPLRLQVLLFRLGMIAIAVLIIQAFANDIARMGM